MTPSTTIRFRGGPSEVPGLVIRPWVDPSGGPPGSLTFAAPPTTVGLAGSGST